MKKDDNGNICGIWGVMSDFSRSFQPWENGFAKGLYLAGAAHDFTDPLTGKGYIYVPIKKL